MNDFFRKIVLAFISVVAVMVIIIILYKNRDVRNLGEIKRNYRGVRVSSVKLKNNLAEVKFSGKLSARDKIDIYTEVGGVLLNDNFREGVVFKKGDILAKLNSREFEMNLKAQKTQLITKVSSIIGDLKIDFADKSIAWELFLNQLDANKTLPELPELENDKLKRFIAGKGVLNSFYSLKAQEEKLSKYTILAPYDGVITVANIKRGTLVRSGQKIGSFINPSVYELETEVSLSDLRFITIGSVLKLNSTDLNLSWTGKVNRINNSVNISSQMVSLYILVRGVALKEGMFLTGFGEGSLFENTLSINRKLLKNGGVYTVDSNTVKFKPVDVLYVNQSSAVIKGLSNGEFYIADNMKGLYDGMQVDVVSIDEPFSFCGSQSTPLLTQFLNLERLMRFW
jgi:multidrug efflux pump subunit AcrA (membrane-fusion protein)